MTIVRDYRHLGRDGAIEATFADIRVLWETGALPETDPTPIETPDAPDDDVPEPDNDVVPETDPNAETAAGTEPVDG